MTNVAGKAYGMNVVTPIRPARTWLNHFLFMVARVFPGTLSGLLGLSLIHFARWVIIRRDQWPRRGQPAQNLKNDYMLFCSNFNGTWDQYIDAFADGIPNGLDLFWYGNTKYPNSIPITPFKDYIRANQIDTGYYYNATPGSGQRDIKAALRLAASLQAIDPNGGEAALAAAFAQTLSDNQDGLGAPGYGPVASCDTVTADRHRCALVQARWGAQGIGPPPVNFVEPDQVSGAVPAAYSSSDDQVAQIRATIAPLVEGRVRPGPAPAAGTPTRSASEHR